MFTQRKHQKGGQWLSPSVAVSRKTVEETEKQQADWGRNILRKPPLPSSSTVTTIQTLLLNSRFSCYNCVAAATCMSNFLRLVWFCSSETRKHLAWRFFELEHSTTQSEAFLSVKPVQRSYSNSSHVWRKGCFCLVQGNAGTWNS